MSPRTPQNLLIAGFLIIIGVIVWWYLGYTPSGQKSIVTKTIQNFIPFGSPSTTNNPTQTNTATTSAGDIKVDQAQTNAGEIARLREISSEPVSGFGTFFVPPVITKQASTTIATSTYVLYAEKATGHVFKAPFDSITIEKTSNATVPKLDSALFAQKNTVVYRYFKEDNETLQTFLGKTASNTATSTGSPITGIFLPENIRNILVAPSQDRIAYALTKGNTTIFVANTDGSNAVTAFSTPLKEWTISWPKTDTLLLTTAPDSSVPGYVFTLNTTTKRLSEILGGINGLTATTNKDLTYLLYSGSVRNAFATKYLNIKTNVSVDFPLATLPEKCVWSSLDSAIVYCGIPNQIQAGNYPEDWYSGNVSFTDSLWKFDLTKKVANKMFDFSALNNGAEADMINLTLDKEEKYVVFMNKINNSLWSYRINDTKSNF